MGTEKSEIGKLASFWIKTLRLEDWDITVDVMPEADYCFKREDSDSDGCVQIDYAHKVASVYLRDPSSFDLEFSLVHELVHVMLGPYSQNYVDVINHLDSKGAQGLASEIEGHELEIAVNSITKAVIKLRDDGVAAKGKK